MFFCLIKFHGEKMSLRGRKNRGKKNRTQKNRTKVSIIPAYGLGQMLTVEELARFICSSRECSSLFFPALGQEIRRRVFYAEDFTRMSKRMQSEVRRAGMDSARTDFSDLKFFVF
jgi:hypothetical protein